MNNVKVVKVDQYSMVFDDGTELSSSHEQDCCENHYLSFEHITLEEVEDLRFDLTKDDFFEKIEDYGIALKPLNGHPVRIPGYGFNNGYYGTNLALTIDNSNMKYHKKHDISECQVIE